MDALILCGIALTVLLLSVMLGKKNKLFADRYLIIYLFFSLLNYVWLYLEWNQFFTQGKWILLGKGSFLLNAPLFFFYVYALVGERPLTRKYYVLMLLPFACYVIHFFYYDYVGFAGKLLEVESGLLYIEHQLARSWTLFVFLFLLSDPFYLLLFYFILANYKKRLLQSASFTDRIHMNWLRFLFYLWLVSALVLAPMSLLSIGSHWITTDTLQVLLIVANVLSTFTIGYYGFKQTTIFSDLDLVKNTAALHQSISADHALTDTETKPAAYERSGLNKEQAQQYKEQLLVLMGEKKPYLNGELNAAELAALMNMTVNHLSQVLNQEIRQNFFDFVNHYRVEEVKAKIQSRQHAHLTLLAIALESGFNSKTSFNTLFKKFTGQTPSQYYKSLSGQ